ncbi:MAG: AMP-binding protein [Actinobacteria bacterium]|nr:AMP-binding protein [Actinomycetota bacterium]
MEASPLTGARTIWELVERRAAATPDRTILSDEHGRSLTCAELRDAVERCAAGLLDLGIRAGTTVSWQLPTRFETIVLSTALARLGAVQNPIIPIYGAREVHAMLEQVGAEWFVVPGVWRDVDYTALATDCCARTSHGCMPLTVSARLGEPGFPDGEPGFPDGDPATLPDPPVATEDPDADEVRWIYTTSGTTSLPKGVMHTDRTLIAGGGGLGYAFEVIDADVAMFAVPWAHIAGPDWLVLMTMWGLPTVTMEAFVPDAAVALMRAHRVTMTGGATALYQALLALQRAQPGEPLVPTLRILMGGGGPKPPELYYEVLREMGGVRITHGYGMTESPMIANGSPTDTDEQLAHTDGTPVPGCEIRIVRDDGTDAAPGEEGDIHLRGSMRFRGYLDPAQTAEVIDADGWFDTGDRGVLRADGHLAVTGRTKDVIIRKGENIGAVEVEHVVYEHPAVAAVAVIGLPDAERGERVCAVVELVDGAEPITLADLQEHCRAAGLSQRKWPEQVEIVDAMPRNPTMKILKFRLKEQLSPAAEKEMQA